MGHQALTVSLLYSAKNEQNNIRIVSSIFGETTIELSLSKQGDTKPRQAADSVEKLWAACMTRLKYRKDGAYSDVE